MRFEAWQTTALLWKEISLVSNRAGFWLLRSTVGFLLFGPIALIWSAADGGTLPIESVEFVCQALVLSLCSLAYLVALVAGSALAASALSEERERGMLEVLAASPITRRQILLCVFGGRLFAVALLFLSSAPLVAILIYVGRLGVGQILCQMGLPIILGAALATSHALWAGASGARPGRVMRKTLLFLLFPPAVFGSSRLGLGVLLVAALPLLLVLASNSVATVVAEPFEFALSAYFPSYSLALDILCYPHEGPIWTLGGWLSAIATVAFFLSRATSHLKLLPGGSESPRRREKPSFGKFTARTSTRLRGLLAPSCPPDRPEPSSTTVLTSVTRSALREMSILERWVYKLCGRNPLVIRAITNRGGTGPLVVVALVIVAPACWNHLQGWIGISAPVPVPVAWLLVLSLTVTMVFVSLEASRLLPSSPQRAFLDTLLTTPLRGRDIALGGAGVVVLRSWPLLCGTFLIAVLRLLEAGSPLLLPLTCLLYPTMVFLAYSLVLWPGLLLKRIGERMGGSLGLLALLGALVPFMDPHLRVLHPLVALLDPGEAGPVAMLLALFVMVPLATHLVVFYDRAYRRLAQRG